MKENSTIKTGDIKLIVFIDGNQEKDKVAKIIAVDSYGILIELWNEQTNVSLGAPSFFLPWHKVNKIKEVKL